MRMFGLVVVLAGCGITAPEECQSDQQCVDAFGWGHTCGARGSCEVLEPIAGCGEGWPSDVWDDRDEYREAIILGAVIDSELFKLERDALHLAVDQINDLGGIDGRSVALIECDPSEGRGDDRETNVRQAAALLGTGAGARVVLGPIQSSDARAFSDAGEDVVLVSPGASAISLGVTGGSPVWRTVPSDADVSQALVRDMIDEALAKAVIVHSREVGQTELAQQLIADLELAGLSGELLAFASATERDAQVVEAAYANADAVVLLSETPDDYVDVLLAASAIEEFEDLVLYVGPAAYRQSLLADAGAGSALFPNVRGVRSATRQGAVADVFRASFSSAYNGADPDTASYAGQAYDSAWAVFSAVMWSGMRYGDLETDGILEGMGNLSFGAPLSLGPSGWDELTQAFGQAQPVDLDGASSPLDFDPESRAIRGPMAIWVIEEGQFVTAREYVF